MQDAAAAKEAEKVAKQQKVWKENIATVKSLYPDSTWESFTTDIILVFWSLAYADIFYPEARWPLLLCCDPVEI